jgi:hypothetical protein
MKRFLRSKYIVLASILSLLSIIAPFKIAHAAQMTQMRAIFDRLQVSTNSGGITMYFATPTGIQTGGADTITLTFSAEFTVAATAIGNFDLALGDSGTCTSATYTEETIAASPSSTEWGVSVAGNVITFSPETDDTLTAGFCIRIELGDDATTGGTGSTSTIVNASDADNDDSIVLGGAIGDSGTISVDIIADDTIDISATVASTITFTISDTSIGFGTLSASAATWATGDTNGSASDTVAHTFTVATNADYGYAVTYFGPTLTSGGNTISVASVNNDANGTPGNEEFGLSLSTDGDATIASGYNHGDPDWTWVASTTTTVVSETGPTATETFSARYIANISGVTEAGSYTTTSTMIATGSF